MGITNSQTGTRVDEVAAGIYRISTPLPPTAIPGGFSFNQYLIADDEPLLFHTGPRKLAPVVIAAIGSVIPVETVRWIGFSHGEGDESGAMNELLAAAPRALPVCGRIGAMVNDVADRTARGLADGEVVRLGTHSVTWVDAPHVPHGWDCGYLFETTTSTLLCGDLFTQPGADTPPVTEGDILGPSEAFRGAMDYYSHATSARPVLERLAALRPTTLACMHGSAWKGDGGKLLRELATAFEGL